MERLSNWFGKISRIGSLNPERIVIAGEKYETRTGNVARRTSLPAVSIPTLERLQKQDPVQGIENFLSSIDSSPKVGNSFDGITKRSSKQIEKGLANNLKALFEKRKRLLSRLQRKSENVNTLIQIRLNAGTVNEEFDQYDDLLKLFLDTHYQHHRKLEDSQQIEDGNWFDLIRIYLHSNTSSIITSKIMKKSFKKIVEELKK